MPAKRTTKRTSKRKRSSTAAKRAAAPAGPLRLQRVLASAGFGSRRQCEELIEAGRVQVDGTVVTRLGTTVDPETAKIRVDGDLLKPRKLIYYAVNKPIGVVTTNRDPQGRPRVIDLVPPDERVFAVGRLDRNSEGLILLTNDGELAQKLTHPKFGVRKVYRVTVAGKVDSETMKQMRMGIYLAEGLVRVEGAKLLKSRSRSTEMEIVLREGKNREIRRILARLGHKVQHLRRIAVGPLRLGDLPSGAYRVVKRSEIEKLWAVTESGSQDDKRSTKRGSKKKQSANKTRGTKKKRSSSAERGDVAESFEPAKGRASKKPSARRSTAKGTATRSAGKRRTAKPSRSEFPPPSELTSNATIGSVIGGDPYRSDVAEPQESTQQESKSGRARKVKPRRGRSEFASRSGGRSSSARGAKRSSAGRKKRAGGKQGKGPSPRGRRKRN